jgi:lipid II:glycine glycyltransferase (peptidoglycan interpeptide bridge formation enzyme)
MLDLAKGGDALFKDFTQTRRSEIRQAMKKGEVTVKDLETEDELNQLYEIHLAWNKRKGNRADSREDFVKVSQDKDHRKTLVAIYQEKVIAGTFFRFCNAAGGGVVEYAGNNSLEEYHKLRANPLSCWRAIEWAAENNFAHFSMGASHDYLRRFGGDIRSNYRYTFDRTFLKRHEKKEKLKKLILGTYLALPVSARRKIKQAFGRI